MNATWRHIAAYLLGLVAAGALATAAFHKAGDPILFMDQISAHQVTPASWSPVLAYFFIALELVTAAAFVVFIWPRLVFTGTILLMVGFIVVTAIAWSHGSIEDCGCFGRLVERGPKTVIIEDVIVIALAALGFYLARGFRTRRRQWFLVAPLVLIALALTLFGTALPIDGIVVDISPGTDLSDMTLLGARAPVDSGLVLVALIGPECPACESGIDHLKQVVVEEIVPHVVAAYPGNRGEAQAWRLKHRPNFPVATSPERVLRQYYRKLPATFLLDDGTVRRVWWNRIPSSAEVAAALVSEGD